MTDFAGHGTATWSSPEWHAAAVAWLDDQLWANAPVEILAALLDDSYRGGA